MDAPVWRRPGTGWRYAPPGRRPPRGGRRDAGELRGPGGRRILGTARVRKPGEWGLGRGSLSGHRQACAWKRHPWCAGGAWPYHGKPGGRPPAGRTDRRRRAVVDGRYGRQRASGAHRPARGGGGRAAHRLRERREPAPRAKRPPRAGAGGAWCARRVPVAPRAPALRRDGAHRPRGRNARRAARRVGRGRGRCAGSGRVRSARGAHRGRRPRARLRARHRHWVGPLLRRDSSVPRGASGPPRRNARRRAREHRHVRSSAACVPRAERVAVHGGAPASAPAIAIGSALSCGAIPASRAARPDLRGGMNEGGRASTGTSGLRRTRSALIAAQVALALMLLVGATLLTRSLAQLLRQDPGFEASGRVALQLFIWDRYDTAEKRARFLQEAGARLSAVPGVRSVGAVSALPYAKAWIAMEDPFTIEGAAAPRTGEEPTAFTTLATPGYFTAAGIPLRRGRFFREGDDAASAQVVLVNEALARRWLQDGDPIGRRITVGVAGAPVTREIVGIVGDVRQSGLEHEPSPELFVPHAQSGFGSMTFVVDGGPGAAALLPSLRAAIWELRPDLPIYDTATLTDLLQGTVAARRFVTVLLVAFACVALVLASVGIYGVISFVTGQRLREFGIRLALGASPGSVVRQTVGGSVRVVAVGILVGLAGTAALTALLRRFLFGITPADPVTYITLVPLVLGIAAFASYLPARRAGRVDPMVVLRAE